MSLLLLVSKMEIYTKNVDIGSNTIIMFIVYCYYNNSHDYQYFYSIRNVYLLHFIAFSIY